MVRKHRNLVLGGGLTGLSCAYHLKEESAVYERLPEIGGLARSEETNGFVFDYAPHILYTIDPYASKLIHELLEGNIHIKQRRAFIYHGKYDLYTQFPFQAHLYGLPGDVVGDCLKGVVKAVREADTRKPTNYKEWIYWRFGKGIAEHLMIPYAERIWTVSPSRMNFEWIDRRVPEPDIDAIIEGALTNVTELTGFNNDFWYPIQDGIESLPRALGKRVKDVSLGMGATRIIPSRKLVEFNGRDLVGYERLISTLPLPVAVDLIGDEAPADVRTAAANLMHNSIVCVNVGINRPDISPYHWLYFYEKEFIFHRISFPGNCSDQTCPPGTSSVCCEIAFSKFRPLEVTGRTNIVERTIGDLVKARILRDDDEILATDVLSIKYAYVIYDLDHRRNVQTIHDYLLGQGIFPCGRFGEWEYFNMDHSIMSGKRTADRINTMGQ